ncbi:hypothetical protein [Methyloversatilis sp.]|nr:hypothetical protein [Methyloversatilis sp.]
MMLPFIEDDEERIARLDQRIERLQRAALFMPSLSASLHDEHGRAFISD